LHRLKVAVDIRADRDEQIGTTKYVQFCLRNRGNVITLRSCLHCHADDHIFLLVKLIHPDLQNTGQKRKIAKRSVSEMTL